MFDPADEDVHSAIERAVTDRLGDAGARLHAGRSRNDLVATDLRLWLLAAGRRIDGLTAMLVRTLVARAGEHAETVMPGTTHTRPAQTVTLGHHLLAHAWALLRDLERFDQWAVRTSASPLGAGALATSTLGARPGRDRRRGSGSPRAFDNSIDAVSDRDFVQEFLGGRGDLRDAPLPAGRRPRPVDRRVAGLGRTRRGVHDRLEHDAAEAEPRYRRARPRRRRPRGGRVRGVDVVLQGLPLGYHRDLQEDKEPLFDAADTLELVLPALVGAVDDRAVRRRGHAGGRARTRGSTRPTSRRRSCAKGCRSARRTAGPESC